MTSAPLMPWRRTRSPSAAIADEAGRMAHGEATGRPRGPLPARARAALAARVEAKAADRHEHVAGVRVDRDPATAPGGAVAHEAARVERAVEQPRARQSE